MNNDYNYLSRPYGSYYDVGAHEYNAKNPLVYFKFTNGITSDEMGIISTGTKYGASTLINGVDGSALSFDGTNDYVDFGTPDELELTGSRTISAWINPDVNGATNAIAAKYLWGYSLFTSYGKLCAYVKGSSPSTSAYSTSGVIINTEEWQHVAMTFNNSDKTIRLYLNGEEVTTYSTQNTMVGSPASTSAYDFTIGSDGPGYNRFYFDGYIDEVKIHKRALSEIEILEEGKAVFSADLDEGSGTNVEDASIYDNDGTINGTITTGGSISVAKWVEGVSGKALYFDGINDEVDFGRPAELDFSGSRSISVWIKPTKHNTYNSIVTKYLWGYSLYNTNGKLCAYIRANTTSASSVSTTTLAIGQWQHVAMTFDVDGDKKIHLYVNGTEVTYSTQNVMSGSPESTAAYDFSIGSDRGTGWWFYGAIDEVKVYDKSLSSSEVNEIYQSY